MGCSYDGGYTGPSEAELALQADDFTYSKWELHNYVTCLKCGAVINGTPSMRGYIDLHMSVCPGRAR